MNKRMKVIQITQRALFLILVAVGGSEALLSSEDFTLSWESSLGWEPDAILAEDFDHDGRQELWVANFGVSVFEDRQVGVGDFSIRYFFQDPSLGRVRALKAYDLDRDGNKELIIAADSKVAVFTVDASLGLQELYSLPNNNLGLKPREILIGDLNQNGIPEIIISAVYTTNSPGFSLEIFEEQTSVYQFSSTTEKLSIHMGSFLSGLGSVQILVSSRARWNLIEFNPKISGYQTHSWVTPTDLQPIQSVSTYRMNDGRERIIVSQAVSDFERRISIVELDDSLNLITLDEFDFTVDHVFARVDQISVLPADDDSDAQIFLSIASLRDRISVFTMSGSFVDEIQLNPEGVVNTDPKGMTVYHQKGRTFVGVVSTEYQSFPKIRSYVSIPESPTLSQTNIFR